MPTLYKFINNEMTSQKSLKWEIGIENVATGEGNVLCTDGVLHGYLHPLLAVFLRSLHVHEEWLTLIEVDASEIVAQDGLKVGTKRQTMTRIVDVPIITTDQRVEIAQRCAQSAAQYTEDDKLAAKFAKSAARSAMSAAMSAMSAIMSAKSAARSAMYAATYAAQSAQSAMSAQYAKAAARSAAQSDAAEVAKSAANVFSIWFLATIQDVIRGN